VCDLLVKKISILKLRSGGLSAARSVIPSDSKAVGLPLRHSFRLCATACSALHPKLFVPGGGVAGRAPSLVSGLELEVDDGLGWIAFRCLFQGLRCKITGLGCIFPFS
jgi:hypothetical protein